MRDDRKVGETQDAPCYSKEEEGGKETETDAEPGVRCGQDM